MSDPWEDPSAYEGKANSGFSDEARELFAQAEFPAKPTPNPQETTFECPNGCKTSVTDVVPWSCAKCGTLMEPHVIQPSQESSPDSRPEIELEKTRFKIDEILLEEGARGVAEYRGYPDTFPPTHKRTDAILEIIAQEADKLANKQIVEILRRVLVTGKAGAANYRQITFNVAAALAKAELDKGDSHERSKS